MKISVFSLEWNVAEESASEAVKNEEKGAENRTLRNTTGEGLRIGCVSSSRDDYEAQTRYLLMTYCNGKFVVLRGEKCFGRVMSCVRLLIKV